MVLLFVFFFHLKYKLLSLVYFICLVDFGINQTK